MKDPQARPRQTSEGPLAHGPHRRLPIRLALGCVLLALACAAGSPGLDAPWLQGDEQIFIAQNPEVTGAADDQPLLARWWGIFTHPHEDLYQPLPILTYAIEWTLWGENRTAFIRQTDVLLHGLNGLLVWLILSQFLRGPGPAPRPAPAELLAGGLAAIWIAHPALATAYAADMGRTHLLAAGLAMLSLWLHAASLERGTRSLFAISIACLALAMMSKVLAAWALVPLAVELARHGLRQTLRSPRVYIVALVCGGFALLNYRTTRAAGILEDAELALFGDPLTRSLLAVWIYARNLLWPVDLSIWYPPDIRTGWGHPGVWGGLAIAAGSVLLALAAARSAQRRTVAIGIVWYWATLLPVLGLVGARVSAAQDRYLYLPLVGLLLAVGAAVRPWLEQAARRRPAAGWLSATALVALAILLTLPARELCADARSMIRRAERSLRHNPGDPRVLEYLAVARAYSIRHETMEKPRGQQADFAAGAIEALRAAARAAEDSPQFFRDAPDRAAFHRRLSFQLLSAGQPEDSLQQAQRAADFQPDAPFTLTRLAHALRALQRWDEALAVYQRLELNLPENPAFRALRCTELGDLLLYVYQRPDLARPRYEHALRTGAAPTRAGIGLARCEVLVGQGAAGLELATQVLRAEPDNLEAAVVVALYHLRSHHWDQALTAYQAVLEREPTHYEALRGLHETCGQLGRWQEAAFAWQHALDQQPDNPAFRAFYVWSAACAGQTLAEREARRLLSESPRHRFAALTLMLVALRDGRVAEALQHAQAAVAGEPLPEARELERAEATLRLLATRGELPPEALILRAKLLVEVGQVGLALAALDEYRQVCPDSPFGELLEAVLDNLSGVADQPDDNPP